MHTNIVVVGVVAFILVVFCAVFHSHNTEWCPTHTARGPSSIRRGTACNNCCCSAAAAADGVVVAFVPALCTWCGREIIKKNAEGKIIVPGADTGERYIGIKILLCRVFLFSFGSIHKSQK